MERTHLDQCLASSLRKNNRILNTFGEADSIKQQSLKVGTFFKISKKIKQQA